MWESITSLAHAILFVAVILILAAVAAIGSSALAIALSVGAGFALIATLIGIVLAPRRKPFDHYEIPHGDVPKVPHGG